MRLGITINFEDTYDIEDISEDLKSFYFASIDKNGSPIRLQVRIEDNKNKFLPNVFNLAFGPLDDKGDIDDTATIDHQNVSKMYSTILLGALTFLRANPNKVMGIDGSNLVRACLYYRLFQHNYSYLLQYFDVFGVKFYIRLLRGREKGDPFVTDNEDLAAQPFRIEKGLVIPKNKMSNYFMFRLPNKA